MQKCYMFSTENFALNFALQQRVKYTKIKNPLKNILFQNTIFPILYLSESCSCKTKNILI